MNDVWGYWTDDGLGMFELLQMAEDMGTRPLLVVSAGCTTTGDCVSGAALQPFIQDALDTVEFTTGGANGTIWGARRAAAGRASPWALEALAVGNENCQGSPIPTQATSSPLRRQCEPNIPSWI